MISALNEEDLTQIQNICEDSSNAILTSAEVLNTLVDSIALREPNVAAAMKDQCLSLLEASNYHDLVGQIVSRLRQGVSIDPLLQGPAVGQTKPCQDNIDLLWAALEA